MSFQVVQRFAWIGSRVVGTVLAVPQVPLMGVAVLVAVQLAWVPVGVHPHSQVQFVGDHSVGKVGVVGLGVQAVQKVSVP